MCRACKGSRGRQISKRKNILKRYIDKVLNAESASCA